MPTRTTVGAAGAGTAQPTTATAAAAAITMAFILISPPQMIDKILLLYSLQRETMSCSSMTSTLSADNTFHRIYCSGKNDLPDARAFERPRAGARQAKLRGRDAARKGSGSGISPSEVAA